MSEEEHLPSKGDSLPGAERTSLPVPSSRPFVPSLRQRAYGPHQPDQGGSLQFVWNALRRRWMVAAPLGLIFAAAGACVVYLLFKPVYEAEAWIRIEQKTPVLAFDTKDDSPYKGFVQTQVQLIRSPMVMGPVAANADVAAMPELQDEPDPIRWLGRQVKVTSVAESELFTISFASSSPAHAASVVKAITDAYFALRGQEESARYEKVVRLLDEQKPERLREIGRLQGQLRVLTNQSPSAERSAEKTSRESTAARTLTEIQNQLVLAEVDREVLKAKITAAETELKDLQQSAIQAAHRKASRVGASAAASLAGVPAPLAPALLDYGAGPGEQDGPKGGMAVPDGVIAGHVEQNPSVQQLKAGIAAKRLKLRKIEGVSTQRAKDASFLQLAEEIRQDEQALAELHQDLRAAAGAELEAALAGRRQDELAGLKSQLAAMQIKEKLLREKHDALLKEVKQFSGDTLEIEFKKAELARAEQVSALIEDRGIRLRTEQNAPSRVTLMRPAAVPTAPVQLYPYRNIILAALAGLCLPLLAAVGWERICRRVGDADSLEREAHLAVVGEIARLPSHGRSSRVSASGRTKRSARMFEESVDNLRTRLVLAEDLRDVTVLAVTSSAKHEGKTSVAAELTLSLARSLSQPVLLVDGDLRSPDVHNIFEVPLEPGLAGVLSGEHRLEDAIVRTWGKYVHLLPAGRLQVSPHQVFGNGALESVLGQLRREYRHIIIDTPPVLPAAEAIVLAKASDACLLCVMRDVSRIDQVKKAYDRLTAAGARVAGGVFNGVPTAKYAYIYGDYHRPGD